MKPFLIVCLFQIVECNALPTLILMLRSEDTATHYEAVRNYYMFQLYGLFSVYLRVIIMCTDACSHWILSGWRNWQPGPLFPKY